MRPSRADQVVARSEARATTTLRRGNPLAGRFAALVVATLWLGACGGRGSKGPAWPEPAEREADGGESLAPRESKSVAAADDEEVAEDAVVPAAAAATTPGAAAATTTPTATTPTITAPEDTIMIEEIVIEISDD